MSFNMPPATGFRPLSETETESVKDFFDAEPFFSEGFDFVAVHGVLTAAVVGPSALDTQRLLSGLFESGPPFQDDEQAAITIDLIPRFAHSIEQSLAAEDIPTLPCTLTLQPEPDESDLRSWCIGFMEGVFLDEKAWFKREQEIIAELTLPIMAVSGLFEDEDDFKIFKSDSDLLEHLCSQIPETLLDLYLFFHVPVSAGQSEDRKC